MSFYAFHLPSPVMQLYYTAPLTADGLRHALLANRTQALTWLYQQSFPPVRRYITRQGGAAQDAQDVFQDARVLLYEQALGGTLVLTASVSTYLLNISRNLCSYAASCGRFMRACTPLD